jgi:hypothetical protein
MSLAAAVGVFGLLNKGIGGVSGFNDHFGNGNTVGIDGFDGKAGLTEERHIKKEQNSRRGGKLFKSAEHFNRMGIVNDLLGGSRRTSAYDKGGIGCIFRRSAFS